MKPLTHLAWGLSALLGVTSLVDGCSSQEIGRGEGERKPSTAQQSATGIQFEDPCQKIPSIDSAQIKTPTIGSHYAAPGAGRIDLSLNAGWHFIKKDFPGAEAADFDDSGWVSVDLPHTWNNLDGQDGGDNYARTAAFYRKQFTLDAAHENKQLYLQFDGSNSVTDVYVNGQFVGQHRGGYAAFRFNITPYVKLGQENVVAVKVSNAKNAAIAPWSADYTLFGGLYRGVHLLVTDKLQLRAMESGSSGVYVKQKRISAERAELEVDIKLANGNNVPKRVKVDTIVVDRDGTVVQTATSTETLKPQSEQDFTQPIALDKPHLWDGRPDPYRYTTHVLVSDGEVVTDRSCQAIGLRSFSIDPEHGLKLNGHSLDLRGISRHQDRLDKGWALLPADHQEDLELIYEMGATAVRLPNYQQDGRVYDLADQLGLVVWTEIPLINQIDTSSEFADNVKQQLKELILQNGNHPSIFFWGLGDELKQRPGTDPDALLEELVKLAKGLDPTRLTTLASHYGIETKKGTESIHKHTDLVAFNKYFGWSQGSYDDFASWADGWHKHHPDYRMAISEFGAGASTSAHADPPSAKGHDEEYQSLFHEAHWKSMSTRPYLWGKFVWTMFDFASDNRNEGDTKGRNDKGLVTYDRKTKKDAFYFYKANWSSEPVVYITSRRAAERGASVEVKVYSNLDAVELKVNGQPLGTCPGSPRCAASSEDQRVKIFKWKDVALIPGDNKVEALGSRAGVTTVDTITWRRAP